MSTITKEPLTRLKAAAIHLALSLLLVSVVCGVMLFMWYPPPLFAVLGGYGLLLIIAGVDIVLGPLLTFIVFRSGKWGMKFDLFCIGACQCAALVYGLYTIAEVRPTFIVFVKDRFELVRTLDIPASQFAEAKNVAFNAPSWFGPKTIGVKFPTDPAEQFALMDSSLAGGADIHMLPKYFASIEPSLPAIKKSAKSLDALKKLNPDKVAEIDKLPQKWNLAPADVGFVVMRAIRADIAMIVNKQTGEILGMEKFTPW